MGADKEKLRNIIEKLGDAKILVVGDLALDEMVYGDTERISREAPVLILQHTHTRFILGGASNAAHNVSKINNGKVSVIGVVGDDYQANDLKQAFCDAKIDCSSLVTDKERKTITKTRISGSCSHSITQQIVRIDRQTNAPISKETERKLIDEIERLLPEYDAVILSDYHIGTLSDNIINSVISAAKKHRKKVVVDAQRNLNRYNGKYTHIPVFNKAEVFDVTGAGDTVTALYTLALAVGAEPVYAAIIGNIAAGIVVKQFGCATTTIDEIIDCIPDTINLEEGV